MSPLVSWTDLGWIIAAFCLSIWLLSSALTGFEKNRLFTIERALRVVFGLALLLPDMRIAIPALGIGIALIVGHRFLKGQPSPINANPASEPHTKSGS